LLRSIARGMDIFPSVFDCTLCAVHMHRPICRRQISPTNRRADRQKFCRWSVRRADS